MVTEQATQLLQAIDGNLNLFELLVNHCRDIMTLHKPDSSYLYASRAVEEVTGFTQQQMIRQTVYELSHPEFEQDIRDNARRIMQGERFLTKPFQYRCADGQYKWFESTTNPLVNDRGKVSLVVLSFRDITRQTAIDDLLRQHHYARGKASYTQYAGQEELVGRQMDRLKSLLEDQQLYLDPSLSLTSLAARMDCHPKFLSYLLNVVLRTSFYDLVNGYRVQEAKKRLVDPACRRLSMVGLAYESGFNSKSAFYQAFKRILKMCPKEFLSC